MSSNPYFNAEGYPDPTAYYGEKAAMRDITNTERRAAELIRALKTFIALSGFELTERVKLREIKTGREFR